MYDSYGFDTLKIKLQLNVYLPFCACNVHANVERSHES